MTHELPRGWDIHQETFRLRINDPSLREAVALQTEQSGLSSLAFQYVRDVRARMAIPGLPFTTGFEGYYVGFVPDYEIVKRERELGRDLDFKIRKLEPRFRREVVNALEGTGYTAKAVSWLDAVLGATLARLRALYSTTGYDPKARRQNIDFREGTYHALSFLPEPVRKIETVFSDPNSLVIAEYPFPSDAMVAVSEQPDLELEERYVQALGMMGMPVFRALAGTI